MSSRTGLVSLYNEMETSSSSSSSISPESRNELSEALDNMRLSSNSSFDPSSASSSPNTKKKEDEDVKAQRRVLRIIEHEINKASNNILLHIKYISSPLRLYLKSQLQSTPLNQRIELANTIKISDKVKQDLVSDWKVEDSFGLKMLVKMYRMSQNIFPVFKSHEEFMQYMKPGYVNDINPMRKQITYYLFHNVMNPGAIYYIAGQGIPLEHNMHSWVDNFMYDYMDDLEEVGFDISDIRKQLVNKLSFELNIYASVLLKKPITFKYTNNSVVKYDAEHLIKELHRMFSANQNTTILAEQMMYWMTTDEDLSQGKRVVKGGRRKK